MRLIQKGQRKTCTQNNLRSPERSKLQRHLTLCSPLRMKDTEKETPAKLSNRNIARHTSGSGGVVTWGVG